MNLFLRIASMGLLMTHCLLADEPTQRNGLKPLDLPPGVQPQPTSPADEHTKQALEDALNGKAVKSGGMLRDVIQVIEQRGSVLDDSVLDEDPPSLFIKKPLAAQTGRPFRVAESLLRTARMLESLGAHENDELVHQMRMRAAKILEAVLKQQLP